MIEYENLSKSNKQFFEEYSRSFKETLLRGWFILGSNVEQFEEQFAGYLGARYCIGVASGLDALILSLKALNLAAGSEVLVPSNTYIATILSILRCGLTPVLVEPDLKTYNIDPHRLEDHITNKTRAVMIVHLYGKPCDMDPIMKVVERHDLKLVEDCAQSHGARYRGQMTGTFGHANAFSFYPTKNLGCLGDGGAVVTNDPSIAESIRKLRNYGQERKYYFEMVGYNSRLDELQAGFLSVKLRKLDDINNHKRMLASVYHAGLSEKFIKPVAREDSFDVYHIFNIRHPQRDELRQFLLKRDIETEIHYPVPPHRQEALRGLFEESSFPISDEIHATTLSLPISPGHSTKDVETVIRALNAF